MCLLCGGSGFQTYLSLYVYFWEIILEKNFIFSNFQKKNLKLE